MDLLCGYGKGGQLSLTVKVMLETTPKSRLKPQFLDLASTAETFICRVMQLFHDCLDEFGFCTIRFISWHAAESALFKSCNFAFISSLSKPDLIACSIS